LRTHIQQLKNTQFIFSGSNQKLMHEIFNTAKRPFFASCTSMSLGFIEFEVYAQFIKGLFEKHKRKISEEAISYVLDFTKQHTFYTQYLCNYLFALTKKSIKLTDVQFSIKEIFLQNESIYYQYKNLLTEAQWKLLRAIAKEDRLTNPHSRGFIEKYKLGTSSMVTRGMEALLAKEMIYQNAGVEKAYYEVYDKFLMRWLQYK